MGYNRALINSIIIIIMFLSNLCISYLVYHFCSEFFLILITLPIIIAKICYKYFKQKSKIILCASINLVVFLIVCVIGLLIGYLTIISVLVLFFYHFITNLFPYILTFLFLTIKEKWYRRTQGKKTGDGSIVFFSFNIFNVGEESYKKIMEW